MRAVSRPGDIPPRPVRKIHTETLSPSPLRETGHDPSLHITPPSYPQKITPQNHSAAMSQPHPCRDGMHAVSRPGDIPPRPVRKIHTETLSPSPLRETDRDPSLHITPPSEPVSTCYPQKYPRTFPSFPRQIPAKRQKSDSVIKKNTNATCGCAYLYPVNGAGTW